MNNLASTERFHALDNLRAIMMWLGIVLHVAINHITTTSPTPWRDAATSPLADLLFVTIHAFRMPVFFILAAFLAAMLVEKHGYPGMLRNRVRKLALPFAMFWPTLFFSMGLLVLNYRHLMLFGTFGLGMAAAPVPHANQPSISTAHMWFIYYLFWFCMAAGAIGTLREHIPARLRALAASAMLLLSTRWWGIFVLSLPLALAGRAYPYGMVVPYGSFIPTIAELTHNGVFFLVGWYAYRQRAALLPRFARLGWRFMLVGLLPFIVCLKLFQVAKLQPDAIPQINALIAFLYGLTSWLWSFGLIGLFLRYLPRQNRVLRYVADSSYWVFLVHMLGTIGFGSLLYHAPLSAAAKMGINILATSCFTLVTYHLFVRNTWIGVVLNGKKADRNIKQLSLPAKS
ncbi:MAG: acyltransferase family protein [Pseudomonadota bacterium]